MNNRVRKLTNVALTIYLAAFHYNPTIDYSSDQSIAIGSMSIVYPHHKTLKYRNEAGFYCANGKVITALRSLVSGTGRDSTHFLLQIQK